MKNGLKRYYKVFNRDPGPSYYIIDRDTKEKIHEGWDETKATNLMNEKNAENAKAKGIDLTDAVETPSNYYGTRNGTPREIAPMVRHGGNTAAAEPEAAAED